MTKELEKLEHAFRKDIAIPSSGARDKAVQAAMQAFEQAKSSDDFQEMEHEQRLKEQGGKTQPLIKWRRMMSVLDSRWHATLAGGASVAVLAMVIAGPNLEGLLIQQTPVENQIHSEETTTTGNAQVETESRLNEPVISGETAISTDLADNRVKPQRFSDAIQSTPKLQVTPVLQKRALRRGVAEPLLSQPEYLDPVKPHFQHQGGDTFGTFESNPVKIVRDEPVSTFSADVDTASYAFMRSSLNNGVLPVKDSVRVEEFLNYFEYGYELPDDRAEPFRANISIMPTPWNTGTKLMSIGIKGYELPTSEAPSANLVFLIDTSGSMNAPNKLPLLRNSFKLLLSNLKPDDRISIVAYAGSAGTVLEPTPVSKREKILSALDKLQAGGATAGAEGIRQAYGLARQAFHNEGINRVILATDGDFNVGISDPETLQNFVERQRETGITLSVLGFGRGNYNDALMQRLAQNGNGNAHYIDSLSEGRKVLVEEAGSTLFPIAKDVKLQVEFNPERVAEYRLIGYESRTLQREDFNNDKVDAGDIGAGHSITALYEITPHASESRLIDELRYSNSGDYENGNGDEYAFLKIRYKLPASDVSNLITRPVTVSDEISSDGEPSADARFAASVAAFGQILRGGKYTGAFDYDDVISLALSGRGEDRFGYRAEFINLVRLAKTANAIETLEQ